MMRLIARLMALFLLAACQMQTPKPDAQGDQLNAVAPDAITVTMLDTTPGARVVKPGDFALPAVGIATPEIPVQISDQTTLRPMPRPATALAAPYQTAAPVEVRLTIPSEQVLCEKSRGQWSEMPSSTDKVCVHRTRDAGKSCRRKTDWQGECMAISGTCSTIMPLVGCNDILQADGRQVTLCLQ